jgi:phage-related baseplate assembly protein
VIGEIGNVDAGGIISFQNAPPTCEKDCAVVSIDTDGSDEEDTEHLRKRIQIRWASRPQGGAYADYWDWATSVDGVLNAYPYSGWDISGLPNSGAGTIVIFIESASGTDGIPTSALLEDVYDLINENESGLADRRPINAYTDQSLVMPITRTQFDLIITGLTVDDSDAAKAAVEEGMDDYFLSREPYINGLSIPPRKDIVSTGDVGGTVATIILAMGGVVLGVQVIENGVGVVESYRQLQEGEKAKLGTITWT